MKSVKCPDCGFVGWADAEYCKKCGAARVADAAAEFQQLPPSYQTYQAAAGGYQTYQAAAGGYSQQKLKTGLAVASLVIGIIDFFTLGLLGVGVIAGVTLALVALSKAKRHPHEYGGQGMAVAGLVTSVVSVFMLVPMGIVAAIAIPNLLASRRAANEGASIASLRMIQSAEETYQATRGNGSYGTLEQLATESLITDELASGVRHGYRFKIETTEARYKEPATFQAFAVPVTYGSTGIRSFFVDETGVIRGGDNRGREATQLDEPLNSRGYSSSSPPERRHNYDDF